MFCTGVPSLQTYLHSWRLKTFHKQVLFFGWMLLFLVDEKEQIAKDVFVFDKLSTHSFIYLWCFCFLDGDLLYISGWHRTHCLSLVVLELLISPWSSCFHLMSWNYRMCCIIWPELLNSFCFSAILRVELRACTGTSCCECSVAELNPYPFRN